jgi:hypothetical protein
MKQFSKIIFATIPIHSFPDGNSHYGYSDTQINISHPMLDPTYSLMHLGPFESYQRFQSRSNEKIGVGYCGSRSRPCPETVIVQTQDLGFSQVFNRTLHASVVFNIFNENSEKTYFIAEIAAADQRMRHQQKA